MSATSSLSVEIWQKILRYSINIPDFLDPSAFDGVLSNFELTNPQCDRNNEAAYWRVEGHRNAFQRVCKSWDKYLRLFEHRYVRISDVWHSKIPTSVLKKAIRVYFDRTHCECDLYTDRQFGCGIDPHYIPWKSVAPLDRLEIVDMSTNQYTHDALISLPQCAKHVKTILALDHRRKYRKSGYTLQVVNWFPELRHFYGQFPYPYWTHNMSSQDAQDITRSNVETLSMIKLYQYSKHRYLSSWDLPNLRYLRIDNTVMGPSIAFTEELYPLLRALGGSLHTLHLNTLDPYETFSGELWECCPKLEKIATTLNLAVPPLVSHPLHTFIATPESLSRTKTDFLEWPNIRTVVVDWIWNNTLTENHIPSQWRRKYPDKVIRIEDQNGLTWKECIELASRVSTRNLEGLIFMAILQGQSSTSKLLTGPFLRR